MTYVIPILIVGFLFRIPRGGPGTEVWHRWIGFGPGSFVGAAIWAAGITALSWYAGAPLWALPIVFVWAMLAESSMWMDYVSEAYVEVIPLTHRGMVLLNPLFGVSYWLAHRFKRRLPLYPPIMDGWTAWAELSNGIITATAVVLVTRALT